jgi:hypothetical protein
MVTLSCSMSNRLGSFPQHLADITLVDADVLVGPADETVELAFSVKSVHALAVEVLSLHLPDDADGSFAHGFEPFDQLTQRKPIVFPGRGRLNRFMSKSSGASGPPDRMFRKSDCIERSTAAKWARTCSTAPCAPSG